VLGWFLTLIDQASFCHRYALHISLDFLSFSSIRPSFSPSIAIAGLAGHKLLRVEIHSFLVIRSFSSKSRNERHNFDHLVRDYNLLLIFLLSMPFLCWNGKATYFMHSSSHDPKCIRNKTNRRCNRVSSCHYFVGPWISRHRKSYGHLVYRSKGYEWYRRQYFRENLWKSARYKSSRPKRHYNYDIYYTRVKSTHLAPHVEGSDEALGLLQC